MSRWASTAFWRKPSLVGQGSIQINPAKVSAVTNQPLPESKKQLQTFLGFANFQWYSLEAAPLNTLTSSNAAGEGVNQRIRPFLLSTFLPWKRKSSTPLSRPWFATVAVPRPESNPPSWFQWAATCRLLIVDAQVSHLPGQPKGVAINSGPSAVGWPQEAGTQVYWLILIPEAHQPNKGLAQDLLLHEGHHHSV